MKKKTGAPPGRTKHWKKCKHKITYAICSDCGLLIELFEWGKTYVLNPQPSE